MGPVRPAAFVLLLLCGPGCAFFRHKESPAGHLSARILPPANYEALTPRPELLPAPYEIEPIKQASHHDSVLWQSVHRPAVTEQPIAPVSAISLEEAIDLAHRSNPTLDVMRERIAQAQGGKLVAFSEFLPKSGVSYRPIFGDGNVEGFALPTIPTAVGNIAYGGTADRFSVTELNVQWLVFDFGRTIGRFGQATAQVQIARLQYERARQTVAFNVTAAYLQALQARALRTVAGEAVRRAESALRDARNFMKRGVGVRNDVLRAEVLLAEMKLQEVKARTAEGIALAALNQAIGINVSSETQVADRTTEPTFSLGYPEALQLAVDNRDEFGVVLRAIRAARLGTGVAQADFMPKIYAGGVGAHLDSNVTHNANIFAGGIHIEMPLFDGGRRVGRLESATAEERATIAQGKEVCDRIAYEVRTAYLLIDDARERIGLAKTAVAGATENLRVLRSLFSRGDATPTDMVDAELAMTRAQQNYYTALYDYQTALARLAYAVGLPVLSDFSSNGSRP